MIRNIFLILHRLVLITVISCVSTPPQVSSFPSRIYFKWNVTFFCTAFNLFFTIKFPVQKRLNWAAVYTHETMVRYSCIPQLTQMLLKDKISIQILHKNIYCKTKENSIRNSQVYFAGFFINILSSRKMKRLGGCCRFKSNAVWVDDDATFSDFSLFENDNSSNFSSEIST